MAGPNLDAMRDALYAKVSGRLEGTDVDPNARAQGGVMGSQPTSTGHPILDAISDLAGFIPGEGIAGMFGAKKLTPLITAGTNAALNFARRRVEGKPESGMDIPRDLAIGGAMHYAPEALTATGTKMGAARNSLLGRLAEIAGIGGGIATGHLDPVTAATGVLAAEAVPAGLSAAGKGIGAVRDAAYNAGANLRTPVTDPATAAKLDRGEYFARRNQTTNGGVDATRAPKGSAPAPASVNLRPGPSNAGNNQPGSPRPQAESPGSEYQRSSGSPAGAGSGPGGGFNPTGNPSLDAINRTTRATRVDFTPGPDAGVKTQNAVTSVGSQPNAGDAYDPNQYHALMNDANIPEVNTVEPESVTQSVMKPADAISSIRGIQAGADEAARQAAIRRGEAVGPQGGFDAENDIFAGGGVLGSEHPQSTTWGEQFEPPVERKPGLASEGTQPISNRPPADYIHPEDTTGAKFGFASLPEISEGELARIQSLMSRLRP